MYRMYRRKRAENTFKQVNNSLLFVVMATMFSSQLLYIASKKEIRAKYGHTT